MGNHTKLSDGGQGLVLMMISDLMPIHASKSDAQSGLEGSAIVSCTTWEDTREQGAHITSSYKSTAHQGYGMIWHVMTLYNMTITTWKLFMCIGRVHVTGNVYVG